MAFKLHNENIAYDDSVVLNNLSLHIQKGEKIALLGKSGSGKSTLLKYLLNHNEALCTYLPQELGLVNNLSVFHNVYIAQLDNNSLSTNLRNLFFPTKIEKEKIAKILSTLEFEEKMKEKVSTLSGGQKQRCAIARAIYNNHSILLADEPISALDEFLSNKVITLLNQQFETVVCALHNVNLAIAHFDYVIGLKDGQVILNKACSELSQEDRQKLYNACE